MLSTAILPPISPCPAMAADGHAIGAETVARVVLYFYPRDDTPGMHHRSHRIHRAGAEFDQAAGAKVIGISKDTVAKHDKFVAKHDLGRDALSDAEGDVCARYGTWVEKNMYGKKSMGIERATFLVDAEGRYAHIWRKVKAKGHAAEVLDDTRSHEAVIGRSLRYGRSGCCLRTRFRLIKGDTLYFSGRVPPTPYEDVWQFDLRIFQPTYGGIRTSLSGAIDGWKVCGDLAF